MLYASRPCLLRMGWMGWMDEDGWDGWDGMLNEKEGGFIYPCGLGVGDLNAYVSNQIFGSVDVTDLVIAFSTFGNKSER